MKNPKIEFRWNAEVLDILGDTKVAGLQLRDTESGAIDRLDVTGVFIAIGHIPNTSVFEGMVDMDEHGYITTTPGGTATSADGVFACGDVQDSTYRQAITAAGSGCMAAIDVERWLEAHHEAPDDMAETATNW